MRIEAGEPSPMPTDPMLAEASVALADGGHWGYVLDTDWRLAYVSDEIRQSFAGSGPLAPVLVDEIYFGSASLQTSTEWRFPPIWRSSFSQFGPNMLADYGGDHAKLRQRIDPSLHDLVDQLHPRHGHIATFSGAATGIGSAPATVVSTLIRLRDESGEQRGTVIISKPAPGMFSIAAMAVQQDLDHLDRMKQVMNADRRSTAILFADLEASSPLSRRLSTAAYFALNRRLVKATDYAILQAGGLVGRHVGDGVVAFFPAVSFSSESAAARACIEAARKIQSGMQDVAERSGLNSSDVVMRFGLHWGSAPYIGGITTGARTEVTALGDEINEAARIEASATGGRTLASKQLIERLTRADATAVDIETEHVTYTQLAELHSATEKARRDAPSIAVCEL